VDTELVAATERSAIKIFEMYLLKRRSLLCSENLIDVFVDGQMVADMLVQTKDEEPPLGVGLLAHFEDIERAAPSEGECRCRSPRAPLPGWLLGSERNCRSCCVALREDGGEVNHVDCGGCWRVLVEFGGASESPTYMAFAVSCVKLPVFCSISMCKWRSEGYGWVEKSVGSRR
jgi:hypothetical protein